MVIGIPTYSHTWLIITLSLRVYGGLLLVSWLFAQHGNSPQNNQKQAHIHCFTATENSKVHVCLWHHQKSLIFWPCCGKSHKPHSVILKRKKQLEMGNQNTQ